MKTLNLTEKQSALLERTLFALVDGLESNVRSGSDHTLSELDGMPHRPREIQMLSRIWFKAAKLEGKAE